MQISILLEKFEVFVILSMGLVEGVICISTKNWDFKIFMNITEIESPFHFPHWIIAFFLFKK